MVFSLSLNFCFNICVSCRALLWQVGSWYTDSHHSNHFAWAPCKDYTVTLAHSIQVSLVLFPVIEILRQIIANNKFQNFLQKIPCFATISLNKIYVLTWGINFFPLLINGIFHLCTDRFDGWQYKAWSTGCVDGTLCGVCRQKVHSAHQGRSWNAFRYFWSCDLDILFHQDVQLSK